MHSEPLFMNDKNLAFYNNLGVDPFKALSAQGGFNTFIDLDMIYPYIKDSASIIELGAGFGRCLDFFIQKGYEGKLLAVEKSKPYLEYLRENYSDRAEILDQDIKNLKLKEKIDSALWMFSGIIDFSRKEQKEVISSLFNLLSETGKLVIDIPRLGFKTYAEHKDQQNIHLSSPYGTLDCYIPSLEDMEEAQEMAGFRNLIRMDYETPAEKERTIYLFEK